MKSLSSAFYRSRAQQFLFLTLAGVTFVAGTSLAASEGGSLSADDFLANIPVAITASRLAQPLNETPTAVTVIDREMIKASGATELIDLLRLVPGMAVGSSAGDNVAVSYHGLSNSYARRMQLLIDGRTVYDPLFGGANWFALPVTIDDIEKIEIIRGPSAASHGANSFLGVISITTRVPSAQRGASVQLDKGTHDTDRALLRFGSGANNLSYRATFEHRSSNGFENIDDAYFVNVFNFRGELSTSATTTAALQLGASDHHGEESGGPDGMAPLRTLTTSTHYEQIDIHHAFTDSHELHTRLFHTSENNRNAWNEIPESAQAENRDPITYDRDASKQRIDVELEDTMAWSERLRLAWGGGLRQDKVEDAASLTEPTLKVELYRLFANMQARPTENIVAHAGAMLEHNSLAGTDISPRLAVNYHLGQHHTLRAGSSRAYRNPVLAEENADIVFRTANGDPVLTLFKSTGGLTPESIHSTEIGYFGNYAEYGLNLDVKLYRDKITNLIRSYFDLTSNALNFRNADEANVTGAEIEAGYRHHGTRANLTYSNEDIDSENITGRYTNSAPQNKWTLFLSHRFPAALDASLTYVYVGPMEWLGTREPLQSYDRLDVRVAHPFKMGGSDCEVAIVGQGLSGPYTDFYRAAAFDRRAYLSLRVQTF